LSLNPGVLTERELIKGCINEDRGCPQVLFDTYAGRLMTVCRRYTEDQSEAEDILQEAFIRIYDNLDQFRFECPLEGWMRRICVNTAIRHCSKKKGHFREVDDRITESVDAEPGIYSHLGEEAILKLVQQLPDGYRMVFNLYVIDGYSHDEIARMMGVHEGTSRSQLAKARRMLQKMIIEHHKVMVA
jgi:RNA polymerase sigma factor (sigma-70 family)